jgi:myxalamid-type polyketide synthase MxaC
VRMAVAAVLGWRSATQVGARQRLFDLGLDSLTAVELRRRLERDFGLSLPVTAAFDYPTPEALAGYLAGQLPHEDAELPPKAIDGEQVNGEPAEPETLERLAELSDQEVASLLQAQLSRPESF